VWVSPIHKIDLSRNIASDKWHTRLQSGVVHTAHNVWISVSCRAINLNTISVAPYRNITQKRRASDAHCSTRKMYMRSTFAPQLALIFRRRIAYNAGYCRSLYFQRMLRRELRAEREKTASMCTLRYVQHPWHCACTGVKCCSFNLGIGCAGSDETDEGSKREKNLSRPRCGRFHNPHNALFVARAMCCERKRGNCLHTHTHTHTFVGA